MLPAYRCIDSMLEGYKSCSLLMMRVGADGTHRLFGIASVAKPESMRLTREKQTTF